MHENRFRRLLRCTLSQAPEVASAEEWLHGPLAHPPVGVCVRYKTGARIWLSLTREAPEGELERTAEKVVRGTPPEVGEIPALIQEGGGIRLRTALEHARALLARTGHRELATLYCFTDRPFPGFGVRCHSGAFIHVQAALAAPKGLPAGMAWFANLPESI